jgi:hypothetical protein
MFRPSDLQLVLLTTAALREDGSLLPPPESIGGQAIRIRRSIPPLIKNGLVSEAVIANAALAWRDDGDVHYGAYITIAGRERIGADVPDTSGTLDAPTGADTLPSTAAPKPTKTNAVLTLLRRPEGATLNELVVATGWLPHTTRAALTGLRKKGHAIARGKRGDTTCYAIERAA